MYRILANIDQISKNPDCPNPDSLKTALAQIQHLKTVPTEPYIPFTACFGEDTNTKRIPVAPSVEDCISAIGILSVFSRCITHEHRAKNYRRTGNEYYPIIVIKYPAQADYIKPDSGQVPDQEWTNEHWLMEPTVPEFVDLFWLGMTSIDITDCPSDISPCLATNVRLLRTEQLPLNAVHPWLTGPGTGHCLSSTEMEFLPTQQVPEYLQGRIGTSLREAVTLLQHALTKEFSDPKDRDDYIFSCLELTGSECYWLYKDINPGDIPYYGSALPGFCPDPDDTP